MYQCFKQNKATANQSGAMGAGTHFKTAMDDRDHFKNGASSKSLTSRRNPKLELCCIIACGLMYAASSVQAQSGTAGLLEWNYNSTTKTLTISGNGPMPDYEGQFKSPWDSYRSSIQTVIIEDGVTSIGKFAFERCSSLTAVTIPNSVTSIGDAAFFSCGGLISVTIPNSITKINRSAFSNCRGLSSITIPNSVTIIDEKAFLDCSNLTSVTIPNSVMSIGDGTFQNCSGLISVTIPNSVTTIRSKAFGGCRSLTSVTIPESVTSIGLLTFFDCSKLATLNFNAINCEIIPFSDSDAYGIFGYSDNYDSYFYKQNNALVTINIGSNVKKIPSYAFMYCNGLISITIPNSVSSIGKYAFSRSGLTSITIPNSVTTIGKSAFENCKDLTSIIIPISVTSIGDDAFGGCIGLTEIINHATTPQKYNNNPFSNANKTAVVLRVPAGSINAYRAAPWWKDFVNIVGIK